MPGQRSTASRHLPRRRTSQSQLPWKDVEKLISNPKKAKRNWWKIGLGAFLFFSFTVPMFRSGTRDHLTLFEFIMNHTIFGPPVEYIPEEDYQAAFNSTETSSTENSIGKPENTEKPSRKMDTSGIIPITKVGHHR